MKLCAIIHCWDDWYLLNHSYENIRPLVDGVIVIASSKSNYGEESPIPHPWNDDVALYQYYADDELNVFVREPFLHHPMNCETDKRNYGLKIAREQGYTHFITMDADEFYYHTEFQAAKQMFHEKHDLAGLVVESYVYFKSPTLTIGKDITLVPHIHKLTPTIRHEFNKGYPFAWSGKQIRIDPTRSLNIHSGVEMFECPMHHYSWVRKDFKKKIRNSTAKSNLERSTIVQDLLNAKEGYFCQFYQKPLVRVPNRFGIPEYGELADKDLQFQ